MNVCCSLHHQYNIKENIDAIADESLEPFDSIVGEALGNLESLDFPLDVHELVSRIVEHLEEQPDVLDLRLVNRDWHVSILIDEMLELFDEL